MRRHLPTVAAGATLIAAAGVAGMSFAGSSELASERPDVLHQHAVTAACSHELIAQAHARGVPVVFTYHTPAVTCLRGTLLHNGVDACDGRLDVERCAPCSLVAISQECASSSR